MISKNIYIKIISWFGATLLLLAYLLLVINIYNGESIWYHLLNAIGSIGLLIEVFFEKNYSNSFLQFAFFLIACLGICKALF